MFRAVFIPSVFVLLIFAGCENKSETGNPSSSATAPTNYQTFEVKGVVVEVAPNKKQVTIKHEAVPNYMPAMTMPFDVKDTNELANVSAGDPVSFHLTVSDIDGWIDHIVVTGSKTNTPPTTGQFRLVRDVEPLNEGDVLPEYHFTNQFGKIFSTKDFKGQALAINFLFTRCPFPTFCPLMANNFSEAQKKLLAMTNTPTNWHLLTISFDPDFDTPDVLKRYGEMHRYDPARWTLATGELIDITAIAEQLGEAFWRDPDAGGISHNLRTAIFDPSGKLQKIFVGNEWTPDDLVAELLTAAKKPGP